MISRLRTLLHLAALALVTFSAVLVGVILMHLQIRAQLVRDLRGQRSAAQEKAFRQGEMARHQAGLGAR